MTKNSSALFCIMLALGAGSSSALADSFRCGASLIRESMTASEISAACGEPDSVQTIREPIMARRDNGSAFQVGIATIEIWTYDFGPRMFPARLQIEEGVATKIELLRRPSAW